MRNIDHAKRGALICAGSPGVLALSACSRDQSSNPKPPADAALANQDKIKGITEALSAAVDTLDSTVERLDSETWRVAPRVKADTTDIVGQLELLKQAMAGQAGAPQP